MIGYLSTWAVIGYALIIIMPSENKSKGYAWFRLFVGGPICWGIFLCITVGFLFEKLFEKGGKKQ